VSRRCDHSTFFAEFVGIIDRKAYDDLWRLMEDARTQQVRARLALEEHIRVHDC
jgi:hypothetical protein